MKISSNDISTFFIRYQTSISLSLTHTQTKVIKIVALVFSFLAASYTLYRYFYPKIVHDQYGIWNGYGVRNASDITQIGYLRNGLLEGLGTKKLSNGILEKGMFKKGDLIWGERIFINGETHKGKFQNDQLIGQGEIQYYDGSIYRGEFLNGELHGDGKMILPDRILEGDFEQNFLNGLGKITFPNRLIIEGNFKNDQLFGIGKTTHLPSGLVETGQYEYGSLEGYGERHYPDGTIEKGIFSNGTLISKC